MLQNVKILGTGTYLPENTILSLELDKQFNKPDGWVQKKSGICKRSFASFETSSYMGAQSALMAIKNANLKLDDIDCIISACGVMEQAIPVTGILIKEQLGIKSSVPCFDINLTCISFMVALDIAAGYLLSGKYKNILIVSSEMPSKGINKECIETYTIFGDGAAAIILSKSDPLDQNQLIDSKIENHIEGINFCQLQGGGTKHNPINGSVNLNETHYFKMDGKKVFKLSSKLFPQFVSNFLKSNNFSIQDIDLIIPHQASGAALEIIRNKLNAKEDQFYNNILNVGNQMSASVPYALHCAIQSNRVIRGSLVLLLGTAAGLSFGATLLRY
ncbi:MAG: hypothetical protein BGO43_08800 [Gammaproteobacteria bacterium 39-13]|nr:MAG: hypothetical protein BGO43_08800 [Gammaproteobacteria bacterium 39-13]